MSRPRVLLADDHRLVTEGLKHLLEQEFDVVGTVTDGAEAVETATALRPDVLLLDISLPTLNGIEVAKKLTEITRTPPAIVFVTVHAERAFVDEAMKWGSGYVEKNVAGAELLEAIRRVLAGEVYVSELPEDGSPELTPRQREVLERVAQGYSAKEIAWDLSLSVKTVEFHKAMLTRRLGLHGTADLTRWAVSRGLVPAVPSSAGKPPVKR